MQFVGQSQQSASGKLHKPCVQERQQYIAQINAHRSRTCMYLTKGIPGVLKNGLVAIGDNSYKDKSLTAISSHAY
jgi:hypothetical protein